MLEKLRAQGKAKETMKKDTLDELLNMPLEFVQAHKTFQYGQPPHDKILEKLHAAGYAERRPEPEPAFGYDDFRLTGKAIDAYNENLMQSTLKELVKHSPEFVEAHRDWKELSESHTKNPIIRNLLFTGHAESKFTYHGSTYWDSIFGVITPKSVERPMRQLLPLHHHFSFRFSPGIINAYYKAKGLENPKK